MVVLSHRLNKMDEALKKLNDSIKTNRFKHYLMGEADYRFEDR